MLTYFVLTLWCLTCNPVQVFQIHHIESFNGGSEQWADLECQNFGEILSGNYRRLNITHGTPYIQLQAKHDWIIYRCERESDFF